MMWSLCAFAFIMLSSCKDDKNDPIDEPEVKVTEVTISTGVLSLKEGAKSKLTANVAPNNATTKTVSWVSTDPDVAEIDDNGEITAKAVGETGIIVITDDGDKMDICFVTVTSASGTVSVTDVSLDKSSVTLLPKGTVKLVAAVLPVNATNQVVQWTSSDPNVAIVDDEGNVTAVAPLIGTATITVTTEDGSYKAECQVTVRRKSKEVGAVSVTGVTLDKEEVTLYPILSGKAKPTVQLTATVLPATATDKDVTWSTSNPAVATVAANGLVTAVASSGTATITVTTEDGEHTADCIVNLEAPKIKELDPVIIPEIIRPPKTKL